MFELLKEEDSRLIEMTENYRSSHDVVNYANTFLRNLRLRMKSTEIIPMREHLGQGKVTCHTSKCLYTPIVKRLLQNRVCGSSCILTQTNEEAVIMVALLRKHGIHGKLIQSMDGFAFWNLAEMRNFLKCIDRGKKSPLISPQLWEEAKTATYSAFAKSSSLGYVKRCIETFEQVNKAKYYSDFYEYVYESSIEDFCEISDTDVVVSTIHKAKGREFDDV